MHTGSVVTRRLGIASIILICFTLLFGLVLSPPEAHQRDAARLLYVHVPSVAITFLAFFMNMVSSAIYLRKGSAYWDLLAGVVAEIGVVFCSFVLVTGAIWGRPTWGVYWQWDPLMTSTAVLFVMYLGYLAVRHLELPQDVRSRRAAVLGIVSFVNVFVVHYSIQWWRGLHQASTTIGVRSQIGGLMLFSLFLGLITFLTLFAWLTIHRFRVAWLVREIEQVSMAEALSERRAESGHDDVVDR